MGDVRGDERWLADGESSVRQVDVEPFDIDVATVTNADVARFVADTVYATEAEVYEYSAVFHLAFHGWPDDAKRALGIA